MPHLAHSHVNRLQFNSHPWRPSHFGQTKPTGQRWVSRWRAQAESSGNFRSNAVSDIGLSRFHLRAIENKWWTSTGSQARSDIPSPYMVVLLTDITQREEPRKLCSICRSIMTLNYVSTSLVDKIRRKSPARMAETLAVAPIWRAPSVRFYPLATCRIGAEIPL